MLYRSPRTGAIDLVMDPSDPEHALRRDVAAYPPQVERPACRARLRRERHLQDHRRRSALDGRERRPAAGAVPRPHRDRRGPLEPERALCVRRQLRARPPPRENERDAYGRPIRREPHQGAPRSIAPTTRVATGARSARATTSCCSTPAPTAGCSGRSASIPADENTIYTLGLGLNVSHDAGKTFTSFAACTAIITGSGSIRGTPSVIYNVNDGGFYMLGRCRTDAGISRCPPGASQFYNVALDTSSPAWAYGSIQDVGSRAGPGGRQQGPRSHPGRRMDPRRPAARAPITPSIRRTRTSSIPHGFYGNFTREDLERARSSPPPDEQRRPLLRRHGASARRSAATRIRPHDGASRAMDGAYSWCPRTIAATIYAGFSSSSARATAATTWQAHQQGPQRRDPAQMLRKSSNAIPYQTIVALAESPKAGAALRRHRRRPSLLTLRRRQATWTDLTRALPTRKWISQSGSVAARGGHGLRHAARPRRRRLRAYVYKSTDFGGRSRASPATSRRDSVNVIREDPTDPNTLYVGTDFGAWVSVDGGRRWQVLGGNLPSVQVSDLQYSQRDHVIVLATYGRGMWAMDATKIGKGN